MEGSIFNKILQLVLTFFSLGKKYTDEAVADAELEAIGYTFTDDGDGNITITVDG